MRPPIIKGVTKGITQDTTIGELEQLLRLAKGVDGRVEVHVRLGGGIWRVTYHRLGRYPKDARGDTLAEALDSLLLRPSEGV